MSCLLAQASEELEERESNKLAYIGHDKDKEFEKNEEKGVNIIHTSSDDPESKERI